MENAAELYASIIVPQEVGSLSELSAIQKAMLDATPDCIKLLNADGTLIAMNRSGCVALGVPENSNFGMQWLSLLPPDLLILGTEALARAASGEISRFSGRSEGESGTVYWDNLLTPLRQTNGEVTKILCVSRDITETVLLNRALEKSADRETLLAGEMRHRIKNLYTVISALSHFADGEARVSEKPVNAGDILRDKIQALSRASEAIFRHDNDAAEPPSEVNVKTLITSVLSPYASRCTLSGADVILPHGISTNLTLYLHELATNCMKYGAFSAENGAVEVRWAQRDGKLAVSWIEKDGPMIDQTPHRSGFGTKMMDRLIQGVGGTLNREWMAGGLRSELTLPVDAKQ